MTELVVRITDLMEAEGRTLRQVVIRLCVVAAVLSGVTVLSLAGVGMLLAGAFLGLRHAIGPAGAAAAIGAACLALAGATLWMNRGNMK